MADEKTTFEQILEAVKAGTTIATALIPFLVEGPAYVMKIVEAWRALGLSDDKIREHIAGSTQETRDLVEVWLAHHPETPRHPGSQIK